MSAVEDTYVVSETSKEKTMKEKRQKCMTIQARIKWRQRVIKAFTKHLKNGTFPKRMKSIRPYPKMGSPESQAIVNAACDQVQCVILDQIILDEEKETHARSRTLSITSEAKAEGACKNFEKSHRGSVAERIS